MCFPVRNVPISPLGSLPSNHTVANISMLNINIIKIILFITPVFLNNYNHYATPLALYPPRSSNILIMMHFLQYFPYSCAFCDFKSGFHSVVARHHKINHSSDGQVAYNEQLEKEVIT